jgi:glycerophosphoryl diester phosphodiesterase
MKLLEIAHRGYSEFYNDNTLEAFEKAIIHKFDMIELDIQLTKDNKIIIYHDTYIKNSNNSYFIIDLTYEEIKSINNNIPLLTDFFNYLIKNKNNNFPLYLDIKGTKRIVPYLISLINKIKKKYDINKIYIGSFNILIIEQLHKLNDKLNYGIISETMFTSDITKLLIYKYNLKFFSFHWSVLQHDEINFLKENNVLVFSYTNKFDIILQKMKQYNLDGIVTNYKILKN